MNSKVIIAGLHLSPSSHSEITALLEKLLRHSASIVRIRLDLHESGSHEGHRYHAVKAIVERRGPDVVVSEDAEDLFTAIHRVVDKLERRLSELARRSIEDRRHPHSIDIPVALPKANLS